MDLQPRRAGEYAQRLRRKQQHADPSGFSALPHMQWALVGAKRLECGSLLPLCLYAQTTCLEPYRHDGENNVSVPISASEGFLRTLRQPPIGTRGNLQATPQSGGKTQTTSLSLYSGPHSDNGPPSLCGASRQLRVCPHVHSKNRLAAASALAESVPPGSAACGPIIEILSSWRGFP